MHWGWGWGFPPAWKASWRVESAWRDWHTGVRGGGMSVEAPPWPRFALGAAFLLLSVVVPLAVALTRHRPDKRARQDHFFEPGRPRGVPAE